MDATWCHVYAAAGVPWKCESHRRTRRGCSHRRFSLTRWNIHPRYFRWNVSFTLFLFLFVVVWLESSNRWRGRVARDGSRWNGTTRRDSRRLISGTKQGLSRLIERSRFNCIDLRSFVAFIRPINGTTRRLNSIRRLDDLSPACFTLLELNPVTCLRTLEFRFS